MTDTRMDFCTDCGFMKTIVHRFIEGEKRRKEVLLCAECRKSRELAAMPKKPWYEVAGEAMEKSAQTRMEAEKSGTKRGLTRDQMTYLVFGLLVGIGIGVAVAYNILKVWFPCG